MKSRVGNIILLVCVFVSGAAAAAVMIRNYGALPSIARMVGTLPVQSAQGEEGVQGTQLWTCGMHPQVIQDHPGDCPICFMKLVPVKSGASAPAKTGTGNEQRKIKYWRAPMDPNFISDKPGKSPMGMDLIPVYEDEVQEESGIRIDPNFIQNFGVRTAVVENGSIPAVIRTVGILDYNQKNTQLVNIKYDGWIEKVAVNYIGEPVTKGEALFEIYSPQLVTTQQEYLAGLEYVDRISTGEPDAVRRARDLLKATRERLRYWDISEVQIAELAQRGSIMRTLKVFSPVSGIVVAKMGDSLEGMRVTPGMNIYKIADLSTVWAQIQVFEYQVRYLEPGQTVHLTVDSFPGQRWTGKVLYLDPMVDPQTRTLKAYVEIANPDHKLRPQMYANVEILTSPAAGSLIVPEEAILHTGERSVVIVRNSSGLFEPREVSLGASGGGFQQVLEGLKAGETVVTSSQFLIDSESNLKEAINKMLAAKKESTAAAPSPARRD